MNLDPKSKKYIFLGYADRVEGYFFWDPTTHKIFITRDVIFSKNEIKTHANSTQKESIESVRV